MKLGSATFAALVTGALILSACNSEGRASRKSALALIDEAAEAMGGWTAIDRIKFQQIQTTGEDWEPLQATAPDAEPRQVNTFNQTLSIDYENKRLRLAFDATRTYPTKAPVKFVEVIDQAAGMLESPGGQGKATSERLHPSRLATRLRDFNRLPLQLLKTARAATDLRVDPDRRTGFRILRFKDNGAHVDLVLRTSTKLPNSIVYFEEDPLYGDIANEIRFSDWKAHDGVLLPETQVTQLENMVVREERVVKVVSNPLVEADTFVIPDVILKQRETGERIVSQWTLRRAVMGVGYQDFGREQKVELFDVAPGVLQVRGGSHHSMVVEMKDHLVVVEAPLFDERSKAVMEALSTRFPGKPVKYLVVTHFHFDHSGGVRAYAERGALLLMPESIVQFVHHVLQRPRGSGPERSFQPFEAQIEGVARNKILSDGERSIELRSVANDHATGMLIAYLPKEKVIFVSDLYSPPGPMPNPSVIFERTRALAFYNAVTRAGLKVNTIVGGHGVVGPFSDLAKAVGKN